MNLECVSPQISEETFVNGLYLNDEEIAPGFVDTVKEFDVENVISISKLINTSADLGNSPLF